MKIKELINLGINELNINKIDEASLKVRILLSHILGQNKEYLIIHSEDEINTINTKKYLIGIDCLKKSMPIQYITNTQEFMGFKFYVDENVLIPQPDTEILVEEVLDIIKIIKDKKKEKIQILDLCTGSGAIGISLSKNFANDVIVTCSDISKEALKIVELNSTKNSVNIKIVQSDIFKNIQNKFDIIVCNPPYIESDIIKTLPKEVQNEPVLALNGGKDGLDFYRIIIKEAKNHLNKDGYLALEIGFNQKEKVKKLLKDNNYQNIYSKKDLGGNDRIIISNS